MRIPILFQLLVAGLCLPAAVFGANCLDLSKLVTKPLHPPIGLSSSGDNGEKGMKDKSEITHASLRGIVEKPIGEVLRLLLDHNTTKSPKVDEMEVTDLLKPADPSYLARHQVKFLIKPFPLVKIRWTEDWAYVVTAGTPQDPKEILINYQKIDGTSHIEHLCGSAVLRKLSPTSTDLYQYEEAKATRRSPEETLSGLEGTLRTLRK